MTIRFAQFPLHRGGDWLADANEKLDAASRLRAGWDGYKAPSPSAESIESARRIIDELHQRNIRPRKIAASVVGGIGVTIGCDAKETYVEVYNDGRAYVMLAESDSDDPIVHPIRPGDAGITAMLDEIQEYMNGGNPGGHEASRQAGQETISS